VTSFGDLFPDNYDDSILRFWEQQLAGTFNHVVDIACGNGALTWIANDLLNKGPGRTPVTGVDFARIAPFRTLRRKKKHYPAVRFIANTPAEKLPFEDHTIDLVISQYGVEYSDLERTIPELSRVMRLSSRMSFVLHDKESVIIKGATERLDDFRRVLDKIAIHEPVLEMERLNRQIPLAAQRQSSGEYQRLLAQINASLQKIRELVRDYPPRSPIHLYMERLNHALNSTSGRKKTDRQALIIEARDALRAHIERVEDLEDAALSEAGRARLVALIESEGFTVTENRTLAYKNDANIGSVLVAQR